MSDTKRRRRPYWIVLAGVALVCAPSLYVLSSGPMRIIGMKRSTRTRIDPATGEMWGGCGQSDWKGAWKAVYSPLEDVVVWSHCHGRFHLPLMLLETYWDCFPILDQSSGVSYEARPNGLVPQTVASTAIRTGSGAGGSD